MDFPNVSERETNKLWGKSAKIGSFEDDPFCLNKVSRLQKGSQAIYGSALGCKQFDEKLDYERSFGTMFLNHNVFQEGSQET